MSIKGILNWTTKLFYEVNKDKNMSKFIVQWNKDLDAGISFIVAETAKAASDILIVRYPDAKVLSVTEDVPPVVVPPTPPPPPPVDPTVLPELETALRQFVATRSVDSAGNVLSIAMRYLAVPQA